MHGLPNWTELDRCYRLLELDPGSSSDLVERSWRKLVDEWRPDRFGSDALLRSRAQTRVNALNHARELLHVHLANKPTVQVPASAPPTHPAQARAAVYRHPMLASTAFACVAIVAVLFARPLFSQKIKPASVAPVRESQAAFTPPRAAAINSEMLLVAHAPLTVSAVLVADGRILLPATTLQAGQSATVPRLGPTYVKYSAGESLEVVIDGRHYAMPDAGPNRAKIY